MYKRNLNYLYRFFKKEKKCAKVRGCYQRDAFIYRMIEIFQGFMYLYWLFISLKKHLSPT